MLQVKNLKKGSILNGISLNLDKGEIAVIVGPSGVGKSTLLRTLCGLEDYDEGAIEFEGEALSSAGMVFQQFHLFEHLSVEKNLTLVLELRMSAADAKKEALRLLEEYGLSGHEGKKARCLSGGQQQRLAIARAIAAQPQVLCMDEPSSALDANCTRQVADQIKQLADGGLPVIVTTHDSSLIDLLQCKVFEWAELTRQ